MSIAARLVPLIVGVVGALSIAGCGKTAAPPNAGPLAVTTLQVQSQPIPFVLETVGRTEGSKEVELRARVSGILQKQLYAEGATVAAGAVLFRIDPAPFEIALAQTQAALAEEQARNSQARRNADRIKELLSKNLVSRNDADTAISALEASDASILAAKAKVREADLNLSYTKVSAPIAGITGRALHSEGSLVTAGTESSLLTTVTQADPLWARFALSASEFDSLREATRTANAVAVELVRPDGSVYPERGRVNFSGSAVDNSLGTVQLRAEFSNKGVGLLPGEYTRVRLTGGARPAIVVPQTAVLQGPKGPVVWVLGQDEKAEQRIVKTGSWVGEQWLITDGLKAGEVLILDNLLKLRPGQPVKSQQQAAVTSASAK